MLIAWLSGGPAPAHLCTVLIVALAIDAAMGDPVWAYRLVPHPVVLIGRLISVGERWLNVVRLGAAARAARGALLVVAVGAITGAIGWAIATMLDGVAWGWVVEAALASTLIAFRGLHNHVQTVAETLHIGLAEGRAAVAHIVGRDPQSLDRAGVARAAVESVAENFSDGVVAPVFWFVLAGLPGLCVYKAINTLDSTIGHRTERYQDFGRASARLDDAMNWLPARLAGAIIVVAAALTSGASGRGAWRAMRRDAGKHRSPNAGWQEAPFAGAFGFALAGPRRYGAALVDDHWMGDGTADLDSGDIRAALRLYRAAGAVLAVPIAAAWLVVWPLS